MSFQNETLRVQAVGGGALLESGGKGSCGAMLIKPSGLSQVHFLEHEQFLAQPSWLRLGEVFLVLSVEYSHTVSQKMGVGHSTGYGGTNV